MVVDSFPPFGAEIVPVTSIEKVASCLEHWVGGVPWEDTAMYRVYCRKVLEARARGRDHGGLKSLDDVKRKCEEYDRLFEQVKCEGRLRTRAELSSHSFREEGGILMHVGPDGRAYHGRRGNRRLAIALALKLKMIPAVLGCVHRKAIPRLGRLRAE
jgi:hypothetical protein